LTLHLQRL